MVIDIASLDLKDAPVLALENLDETPIAILGNAFNIEAHIAYNDTSSISFDLPAYANGMPTPGYNDVIGTRLIRIPGWGVFILVNPEVTGDGIKEIKSCKAYSREYEMTYKKMTLEENTYNLWNPVTPDSTILGIITNEYLPYWHVGTVDSDLVGKYRTFSESNVNLYNFLKSTVQQKYGCIVDFDTVTRTINVRSTANHANTKPVFVSLDNLAKEISREEDTENIFTCLDVNGADGVTIRGVNPTGTNKIYNLDYYMNTSHFSHAFIDKWHAWEQAFDDRQESYQILTIQRMMKTTEIVSARANIDEIYGAELGALQAQQSVYIEALARLSPDSPSYPQAKANLTAVNAQISAKHAQIVSEQNRLTVLEAEKDALTADIVAINRALDFSAFFTADELLLLKQYFKEDSIQDGSFVYAEAKNYTGSDESREITSTSSAQSYVVIDSEDAEFTTTQSGNRIVSCVGGTIQIRRGSTNDLSAAIIRCTAEHNPTSRHTVLTAYLSEGTLAGTSGNVSFPNGCLTVVLDGASFIPGTYISFVGGTGRMYFTRNTTEYEKYAVEWELYEYGRQCLEKLAHPSYSFSVEAANFLTIDAFESFKNSIQLGQKIYLDMGNDQVLEPIFIGFEVSLEDPSSLKLEFGDKYCLSDSAFELADLLNQSVSMGKTVDTSRFGYNAFIDSGASTAVKDYMDAALDVAKQAVLSSTGVDITWDESGMTFRKKDPVTGIYDDKQIKIVNNNIVFTDDAWATAKMAIGNFQDDNAGDSWGIVAPNIVGTLLAGENLVIESTKQDGGTAVFKVDGDGAVLHNSKFDIVRGNAGTGTGSTHILIDPGMGFGIGTYPVADGQGHWNDGSTPSGSSTALPDNVKFWVDMDGNVHLKGRLHGVDGTFSGQLSAATGTFAGELSAATGSFAGDISAASGTFTGTIKAAHYLDTNGNEMFVNNKFQPNFLNLKGLTITNANEEETFKVTSDGNVTVNGNITLGPGTTINWNQVSETGGRATKDGDFNTLGTEAYGVKNTANNAFTTASNAFDNVASLALGTYIPPGSGTPFISEKGIYSPQIFSPEIFAETFTAISSAVGHGAFVMNRVDSGGQQVQAFKVYYWDNEGWESHISAEGSIVLDNYTRFLNGARFDSGTQPVRFNGPIVLLSGKTYGNLAQRPTTDLINGQIFFEIN